MGVVRKINRARYSLTVCTIASSARNIFRSWVFMRVARSSTVQCSSEGRSWASRSTLAASQLHVERMKQLHLQSTTMHICLKRLLSNWLRIVFNVYLHWIYLVISRCSCWRYIIILLELFTLFTRYIWHLLTAHCTQSDQFDPAAGNCIEFRTLCICYESGAHSSPIIRSTLAHNSQIIDVIKRLCRFTNRTRTERRTPQQSTDPNDIVMLCACGDTHTHVRGHMRTHAHIIPRPSAHPLSCSYYVLLDRLQFGRRRRWRRRVFCSAV